jgi:hypothetical protein
MINRIINIFNIKTGANIIRAEITWEIIIGIIIN